MDSVRLVVLVLAKRLTTRASTSEAFRPTYSGDPSSHFNVGDYSESAWCMRNSRSAATVKRDFGN